MKRYEVRYLTSAKNDLYELLSFLSEKESTDRARLVLNRIRALCEDLASMPSRGHVPPELAEMGSRKFLELHFKPYRMIYQVTDSVVYIHLVCDGRRDMQSLLRRRLLSPGS
ncbi:type II toxin-antitoxin system RelE/ParE family toxin [Mariprofundus ferrooxydans]|uniref:type II toxin-antitoxin system RelE/ParE family toxin n=1 Tax=Mariprofundus ferrooxydans TaxID=314344 RepID=UPI0003164D34|nr:type II toxin-antitoxin system RelE/ParE family toxin [Mariprofundus ferrooxydans]